MTAAVQLPSANMEEALKVLAEGLPVHRVKRSKLVQPASIFIDQNQNINFSTIRRPFFGCFSKKVKRVNVAELLEIREGYNSDGLHRASKHFEFQEAAPEARCFSIIYKDPSVVCRSVDFVSKDEQKARLWIEALKKVMTQNSRNPMTFDEKLWIINNFRSADLDREISFNELWKLLRKLNLQLKEKYVRALFKEITSKKPKQREALSEAEFTHLFEVLTDLPEYRYAVRLASSNGEEFLNVEDLRKFLADEQGFTSLDEKKVETIIGFCETSENNNKNMILSVNGFRRLLQSRWGNILKEDHESVFQDMDQPLASYFINASHNTYLTGSQVHGNATVEGYINALRQGARLLELDVHDGADEPMITHKLTLVTSISLRDALKCIAQYAFQLNPFPVILTVENHVGPVQQRMMADIFVEVLGDSLYIPPADAGKRPLPSPKELRKKFLLRGKTCASNKEIAEDAKESSAAGGKATKRSPIDPSMSRLIALPSHKLSSNLYLDAKEHPFNASPTLAEGSVRTYVEAGAPLATYTATHLVKSYPGAFRQNSSNMSPVPSWLCGIQAAAMNMQTASEEMDVAKAMFIINGSVGYVLKPKILLDGIDPTTRLGAPTFTLHVGVICGQYLSKSDLSNDIVDPFVSVEIFGVPADESKFRTRPVKNNGFNPVWNDNFKFTLTCPELAIIRFSVKDFDSTSSNDFIGEFSVPISSIRTGYSHIRLNTGLEHSPDDAASILIRTAFGDDK